MNRRYKFTATVAITTALVIAFAWWMAGYNYDHRDGSTFWAFLLSFWVVWWMTIKSWDATKDVQWQLAVSDNERKTHDARPT